MRRFVAAFGLTIVVGLAGVLLTGPAPAYAAVTGATIRSEQTEFSATTPKVAIARCPEGKRVTGGFGRVTGDPRHVVLTRMEPVHTNNLDRFEVAAAADETDPTGQWAVTAVAICADPLPDQQILSFTVDAPPGTSARQAFAACPGGLNMIGSGGRITGGQGEVDLSRTGPVLDTQSTRSTASGQADSTGFAGAWSVTAFVVCARVAASEVAQPANDSDLDSEPQKAVEVNCPPGMFVTGGGGQSVNGGSGNLVIQSIMPEALPGAIPGDRATLTVRENTPVDRAWLARGRVHCAA
ncbi:hypothetical protein ACFP2T_10635 [Plantactinospora solaniradicis]|uniref:Septum formation-related domain-containing protein n=1 Tax=Plantactinospora solaniradicis TaxID=1723736 RepID=A0ABW1K4I9_9ACTN